jgi:hypothetical protein
VKNERPGESRVGRAYEREIARACFDIDKIVTVKELRTLGQILIDRAATIEMIAAERVFDATLNQRLAGQARTLRRVARTLQPLQRAAAKAKPPKVASTAAAPFFRCRPRTAVASPPKPSGTTSRTRRTYCL